MIPWFHHNLTDADSRAVAAAVDKGWVGPGGPLCRRLEDRLAELLNRRHVVLANSGTTALEIACRAVFDDGPVAVPTYGPVAIWNAVVASGRRLVPYMGTTVNALLVDMNGEPERSIGADRVVEDACQAFASDGVPLPESDAVVMSFSAQKIVTGGQGGAIAFDSGDAAAKAAALIDQGGVRLANMGLAIWSHGRNLRMTEIQAALILAQWVRLHETRERTIAVDNVFRTVETYVPGGCPPFHHVVNVADGPGFVQQLAAVGVEAKWHVYRRLGAHPGLQEFVDWPSKSAALDCGGYSEAHYVMLPFGPGMTVETAKTVVEAVRRCL